MRRQALGWPAADVATRCGIDPYSLNEWECGLATPPLDAAQAWAKALGFDLILQTCETQSRQGLKVDWSARRVTVDGTLVRLTPMEWKALERLARAPGEIVSHQALFLHLYGEDRAYRAQSTAIRVLITKLRRLLPLRIEAQWGKGYVLTGVSPSRQGETENEFAPAVPAALPKAAVQPPRPPAAPLPLAARRDAKGAAAPNPASLAVPVAASPAAATTPIKGPSRRNPCRAEELGDIERFLAERGVTRCPDVAAIQRSPLPTLVWDKLKRKWVRPAPDRQMV